MSQGVRQVFLSHSSDDIDEVLRFDRALRQCGVPLWRDRSELPKGRPSKQELERAGNAAIGFAFYVTEKAAQSQWVREVELKCAIENAACDYSFGIVPIFRDDKNRTTEIMMEKGEDRTSDRYDLRGRNGYIMNVSDEIDIAKELSSAAHVVLLSTIRTMRERAVRGGLLRIAAITRHQRPWHTVPTDLVVDWSHAYPPDQQQPPHRAIGADSLLPALDILGTSLQQEWQQDRIQITAKCHPSMALAIGFLFRRNSGYELHLVDAISKAKHFGPRRPLPPDQDLWRAERKACGSSGDLVAIISVSRDARPSVEHFLETTGMQVGHILTLSPQNGPGHTALPEDDPSFFHRLAVAAVKAIDDLQQTAGSGVVHLFTAAPNTLLILLAQQLTNIGQVQVYEFDQEAGTYVASFMLCNK